MATYAELLTATENSVLRNRVRVAIWVAAETIRTEPTGTTNHTARMAWAKRAFENPDAQLEGVLRSILTQNRAQTLAAIIAADDASVQTAVTSAVDVFI